MRDKAIVFLLLVLVAIPLFTPMVSAAGEDLLGGMGQQIIDTVMNIANYEVTFPASSVYGMDPVSAKAPLWNYVFVFMIIFSILWLASAQVPLFKDQENQGPRKAFAIAFSFLTMLGTPAVSWVKKLISTFTNLAMIAILVLGVYTIWVIFKGGWAANRKTGATATSSMAEATREVAEAKRVNAQTAEYKKKTEHAIRHGMTQQVTAIKSLRGDLTTLLGKFNGYPGRAGAVSTDNSINKLLGKISSDAGKILTYMTENDRMMTGMTKRLYDESGTTGLGSSRATTAADIYGPVGRRVTEVMKNGDTQTNDLGRIISGMAERVRAGIPANVNELRDMTAQAINITQRMERDIVLESQMIEKI